MKKQKAVEIGLPDEGSLFMFATADKHEQLLMTHAANMCAALNEFKQWIRNELKYEDASKYKDTTEALEAAKSKFWEIMVECQVPEELVD